MIHYGPASNLDDYFQETGRIGRDGSQSLATLLVYDGCKKGKGLSKDMKSYMKNKDECRRKVLLKCYGSTVDTSSPSHLCCDLCKERCSCGECPTFTNPLLKHVIEENEKSNDVDDVSSNVTKLSPLGKQRLRDKLNQLRSDYLNSRPRKSTFSGSNITTGFPARAVTEIVSIANSSISEQSLSTETSILNELSIQKF